MLHPPQNPTLTLLPHTHALTSILPFFQPRSQTPAAGHAPPNQEHPQLRDTSLHHPRSIPGCGAQPLQPRRIPGAQGWDAAGAQRGDAPAAAGLGALPGAFPGAEPGAGLGAGSAELTMRAGAAGEGGRREAGR